jgi:hypothetical protein
MAILAASGVWVGAWLTVPDLDIPVLLKASSLVLLGAALLGMWLVQRAAGRDRLGIALILEVVEARLFSHRTGRAVCLPPGQQLAPGIVGLIEAVVDRMLRWKIPFFGSTERSAGYEAAMRQDQADVQMLVSTVYQDADLVAETSAELQASWDGISSGSRQADATCRAAEVSINQVIERVTSLTGAVGATTAEVQRVTASAIALADSAFAGQRSVAGLDDHTATLVVAVEQMEQSLKQLGNLAQSAAMEAAGGGESAQALAPIVLGIRDLAGGTLAALAAIQAEVGIISGQAANASVLAQDVCERVKVHHELGLGLSSAVRQQGLEIAGILRMLDAASSGFLALRASVEAVTRHGSASLAGSDTLRAAAARLPGHADAMARILRELPDLVSSRRSDV